MKRLVIVVLCLLLLVPMVQAQEEDNWWGACESSAQAAFSPLMGEDTYNAACEVIQTCDPYYPVGCDTAVYDRLTELCEDCELQNRFYTASLFIFETRDLNGFYVDSTAVQAIIPQTFADFEAGNYQAIIDAYEAVKEQETLTIKGTVFYDYIIGLMYEELGDLESAAAAYQHSIDNLRMPIVTYQRAEVLEALGYEDVAAAELLAIGAEDVTFPEDLWEAWVLYPIERNFYDETLIAPFESSLAYLSDGSILFYIDDTYNLLYQRDDNTYAIEMEALGDNFTITFQDDNMADVSLTHHGIEEYSYAIAMIVPEGTPDPRDYERCEDGARWRLEVGSEGSITSIWGNPRQYFDAPDGEPVGEFDAGMFTFLVVGEPVCVGNQAWWQITIGDDETIYWTPEAEAPTEIEEGIYYLLEPA